MRNKVWLAIAAVGIVLFSLWACAKHDRSMLGRYMAPPNPLTLDDIIPGPMIADFESQTNYDRWNIVTDTNDWSDGYRGTSDASSFWINTGGAVGIGMLKFTYMLGSGYRYRYVNVGVGDNRHVGSNGRDLFLDASGYDGIHFWLKGATNKLRLNLATRNFYSGHYPARYSDTTNWRYYNWDFWGCNIEPVPADWTEYFVLFSDLYQKGFGSSESFDASHITKVLFETLSMVPGESGYFYLDDIYLFKLR